MKKDWEKVKVEIRTNGEKTITYTSDRYPDVKIESRKRNIPHANGTGTWSHTDYAVIWNGGEKIKYSLKDAMEYAEALGGTNDVQQAADYDL